MVRKTITLILFATIFAAAAFAGKQNVKSLPDGVSIFQLDNGLQVLLIENPALPMVGVNTVVKIGSAYENFASSGMSHMLEHLLFNGTTTRTQQQLYDDVDMIGGYNNANTSEYYTNYMMVVPAEFAKKGLELQADMLFNSVLPEKKFEKEKGIVLEEISKSLAKPNEQLERNIISILYPDHALSLPTLGTYSTIESMNRDDVYNFYKSNYVPNNMIMSVIGNFDSAEMLKTIKEIYGKAAPKEVSRGSNPEWQTGFESIKKDVPREAIYHRFYSGKDVKLQMFFKIPVAYSLQFYDLLDIALKNAGERIQDKIQSKYKENVIAVSLTSRLTPVKNVIELSATLKTGADIDAVYANILQMVKAESFSLSKDEVEVEAAKSMTYFFKNIEKPHMFGIFNAGIFAEEGIEGVLAKYDADKFNSAAQQLSTMKIRKNPVVIIQHPSGSGEKTEKTEIKTQLFGTKDGKAVIAVQNSASNLLAVHYLIKHKKYFEEKYGKDAAKIMHDCFGQRIKSSESQKLSAPFGLSVTVNDNPWIPMDNIYMNPDFGYIRVEGLADDIPGAIAYLNKAMLNFTPTEEEYNKALMKFKRSAMMKRGSDPAKKMFSTALDETLYGAETEANPPELTYESLLQFTRDYFHPQNMIIAVVSKENPEKVNELFASFNGGNSEAIPAYVREYKLPAESVKIEKEGGGERSYLFYGFMKQIDEQDKPAIEALSLVLKDDIIFDIREKQGMAYHMSAGIKMVNDKALFYINQGTRPQNVDKLLPQYPGFFKEKRYKKLTEDKLQKSINMYLGRMMFRRLASINQAYYLSYSLYFKDDINYDKDFLEKLKNVRLEDVRRVMKKYMRPENEIEVIVR